MADLSGQSLGAYHLLRPIGRGGMGEVYLAEDPEQAEDDRRRQVAIKVVHVEETTLSSDADALRLFREGRFLIELAHPHILPVYHDGIRDDLLYLVMPYMPDGSLADAMHGRSRLQLRLPLDLDHVVDYIEQVAEALQYVHDRQVIHRDVKPGNVLIQVQADGRWWLLLADFGIARRLDSTTREAQWRGTITYMAPEQFRGEVSPAADQYALGVLAFQLLSGQVPWGTAPPAVRTLNPAIPEAVEAVLLQALAARPEQRFPSVTAFAEALRVAAGSSATTAAPQSSAAEEDELAAGRVLLAEGRYVGTVTVFQGATEQALGTVVARLHLAHAHEDLLARGKALVAQQSYAEAVPLFERATQLAPRSFDAWANLGLAYNQTKQHALALNAYDHALAIDDTRAWVWTNKGNALRTLKRDEEALAAYERALTLDPTLAFSWYNKGNALRTLKRDEEALAAYERATTLDPTDARACNGKGAALSALKRDEEALAAYERATTLDPTLAIAWYNKGLAFSDLKRPTEALAAYERAITLDPSNVIAWIGRGNTCRDLNLSTEALEAFERATTFDPSYAYAWYNKGLALEDLQRYGEALTAFDRGFDRNDPRDWRARARIYRALGRTAEATAAERRAEELGT